MPADLFPTSLKEQVNTLTKQVVEVKGRLDGMDKYLENEKLARGELKTSMTSLKILFALVCGIVAYLIYQVDEAVGLINALLEAGESIYKT